jgi:DNA-binding HxlR family transcriptional regulator
MDGKRRQRNRLISPLTLPAPPSASGRSTYVLAKRKGHGHEELRCRPGNISQRMLTRTLSNLEAAGLSLDGDAIQICYGRVSLTNLGRTFVVPSASICRRANHHRKRRPSALRAGSGRLRSRAGFCRAVRNGSAAANIFASGRRSRPFPPESSQNMIPLLITRFV